MAIIEVDEATKQTVAFAAHIANVTEAEIIRKMISASAYTAPDEARAPAGEPIHADYEGRRTHALYFAPARVEITDGPLAGKSFKTPTGAARAVVALYNASVNANRNGWSFWQRIDGNGRPVWLQSIRPA